MSPELLAAILERIATLEAKAERHERFIRRFVNVLTTWRNAVLMALGGLEEFLGIERTKPPRHKQK